MRRVLVLLLVSFLLISPVLAEDGPLLGVDVPEGEREDMDRVRQGVISLITDLFGSFAPYRISGALSPTGLFTPEFLAAFFIVYFFVGSISSFQLTGGPADFLGGGLPKILFALFLTLIMWNTLGGMRYERLLILMVPPMIVYYVLSSVLKNFALVKGNLAKLVALTAAMIAFFFYSPRLVDYVEGRFSYGVLDNLALGGTAFFVVYIFGFFLTKFTNEVLSPINNNEAARRKSLNERIERLPEDKKRKVKNLLGAVRDMERL